MGGEWQRYEVKDLLERGKLVIGDGYRAKNSELSQTGLPFARAGNVNDGFQFADADYFPIDDLSKVGNKVSQPGDVVFTSKGTVGRFAFVHQSTPPFVYSPQLCFWRVLDLNTIDSRFLYYWMCGGEFFVQYKGVSGQTDMAEYVSLTDQRRMQITLPSVSEQRAIAHILGALDDKVELNWRMKDTLHAMVLALYRSWFIEFAPARAKAEGRDTGLPKDLANLFPDSFAESELGEIPRGWTVSAVGEHMQNRDSKRIPLSGAERAMRRGSHPYYGAAGVLDHVDDYLFEGIHLLVGEDGSVMRSTGTAVTQYVWGKFWVNNHAHVLQGAGAVSTEQLYLYFLTEPVAPFVTGAVQAKLSQGRMNTMPMVFPGEAVCSAFGRLVRPLFAKLRKCEDESRTLAAMLGVLVPKLIAGELRVAGVGVMEGAAS